MTSTTTARGATNPTSDASAAPSAEARVRWRSTIVRSVGATILAIGIGASLAACGPMGAGTGDDATATPDATEALMPGATGDVDPQCADALNTLTTVEERLAGLPEKIPGDIPGAIGDVQTSVTDLQTLREGLADGELKNHVDSVIARGNEALEILNQAQSGEITPLEATAQGAGKAAELFANLEALRLYCSFQ